MSWAKRASPLAAIVVGLVVLIWVAATAGLYVAMRQPPERFGAIMSRVPGVAMMVLPFKPLWMSARGGQLRVGDTAPDFSLPILHSEQIVTLSEEYRQKPVVLVFGSYT
jgi:hypothetical protein